MSQRELFARPALPRAGRPRRVDLFAGGGGASIAIEAATGEPVDLAINHAHPVVSHTPGNSRTYGQSTRGSQLSG